MANGDKILINNYNKTRNITRTIYLYGIYNNEHIYEVSQRKLSNEKTRIKSIYATHYKSEYYKNRKYIGLFYDQIYHSKNFLANSYFIRTFTDDDFILYFSLLEIINDKPKGVEEIIGEFDSIREDIDTISKSTFDRKLSQLCKEGLVEKIPQRKHLFKLKEEFFKDFSSEEKVDILHAVMFFVGITPYKVPGHYLIETLKNYSDVNVNNFYDDKNNYLGWFSYTNNHIQNILDEIILYNIEENKAVQIKNKNMQCDFYYQYKICDKICGRMYVLGKVIEDNKITNKDIIFRLDRIKEAKKIKYPKNCNKVERKDLKMWCASFDPQKENIEIEKVEAIFYINEVEKMYLVEKIKKEKQWGKFEKIEDNKFFFSIDVSDAMEMLPWFRSYEGYVVVLHEKLREALQQERQEMLEMYMD